MVRKYVDTSIVVLFAENISIFFALDFKQKNTNMKNLLSAAIALIISMQLFSQNKKGNWMVGTYIGSTGASFGKSESSASGSPTINKSKGNSFNIGVGPSIGYYFSDNMVIGTSFGLSYYNSKSDNSNTTTTNTYESKYHYVYFSLGPYGRFYLGKNNGKGMPFVQLNAGISLYPGYKGEYNPSTGTGYTYETEDYHPLYAGVQFGYEHFLNTVLGLQYYIGYSYSHSDYNTVYHYPSSPDISYNNTNNNHNINFGVGLVLHFECTKKKRK